MGLFNLFKKKEKEKEPVVPTVPKSKNKFEKHHVAGTYYKKEEILELAEENPDYFCNKKELEEMVDSYEKVYEYSFFPGKVELIEEPNNEHDPNAIKVIIDNVHVGYIKKGSCSHIKKLIHEDKIISISAEIKGGKYKMLVFDEDNEKANMKKDKDDFFINLELTLKDE